VLDHHYSVFDSPVDERLDGFIEPAKGKLSEELQARLRTTVFSIPVIGTKVKLRRIPGSEDPAGPSVFELVAITSKIIISTVPDSPSAYTISLSPVDTEIRCTIAVKSPGASKSLLVMGGTGTSFYRRSHTSWILIKTRSSPSTVISWAL
jgi:hypothetical protein